MKFILKNRETGETKEVTKKQLLEEINEDRSEEWINYTLEDFGEGLEDFTDYNFIGIKED